MIISIGVVLVFVAAGAIAYRMHGGGGPDFGKWFDRVLIGTLFAVACYPFAGWYALFAYLGIVGIATGHGQYFPGLAVKHIEPEFFDFIVRLFYGTDPRTNIAHAGKPEASPSIRIAMTGYGMRNLSNRCSFGMFVTGALVGLPAVVLALAYGRWIEAMLFCMTGPFKAVSYRFTETTEMAERVAGGLFGFACGLVYIQLGRP